MKNKVKRKKFRHQTKKDEIVSKKEDPFGDDMSLNAKTDLFTLDKIKNKSLRESFKKGLFKEGRKKERGPKSSAIPKVEVEDIVSWVDKAISNLNQNNQEMIKRLSE